MPKILIQMPFLQIICISYLSISLTPIFLTHFLSNIHGLNDGKLHFLLNQQYLMDDRRQERNARATLAKQAYLRQHIPAADYEDFGQYCEETVGNTAIEGWSLEFVIELVDKFKRKLAERKQQQQRQPQEKQSFYAYQTGRGNEIKELSQQIKQEQKHQNQQQPQLQPQPQPQHFKKPLMRPASKGKQETALEVLDSIFKNQKQTEFTSNKYDKSVFESKNFWQVAAQEEAVKQKENDRQSQIMAKKNQKQAAQFVSNKLPLKPEKFQQIFTTGIKLPETKNEPKQPSPKTKFQDEPPSKVKKLVQISPKPKKGEEAFQQFNTKEASAFQQTNGATNGTVSKVVKNGHEGPNNIKLLSVKSLNTSKIPFQGQILFPQPFRQNIACFKSFQRHALSLHGLNVTITGHEIINRSFFSSDYVMYHLRVTPSNIICKRNLEDFQKLRKNLQSVYPGVRVPYIERVGLFGSETTPENIEKQKKYLTFFLEDLLSHSELKNFRILEDFLTLKDHKLIKRKFEQYDKMKQITAIEELCLLEGAVKIDISEPTRQYNQQLETFTSKLKDIWGAQDRIMTQIHDLHRRIADSYKELAEVVEAGSKEVQQFNRRVSLNQIDSLDASFQNLLRYTSQNIKMHEKECELLRTEFLARIRYERQNMGTLDTVADIRTALTRSYLKRRESEKSSDTLDYLSERLKEYKTSITEESKSLTVLKHQTGYINQLMMTQGHHYFSLLAKKVNKAVSNTCFSKIETYPKILGIFSELVIT